MKQKNVFRAFSVACAMLICGVAVFASPSKTANAGLWSTDSDNVSSKIGLGDIDFSKFLASGEYNTTSIILGAAANFQKVRMGINYTGNFWNMKSSDVTGNWGTSTTPGFDEHIDNKNDLSFTFHIPAKFRMGVSVGFELSGNYEKGDFDENFRKITDPTTKKASVGKKDDYVYVPKIGYAIKIPVGEYSFRPQIDFRMGYAPHKYESAYSDITTGGGVKAERSLKTFTPTISFDIDFGFPAFSVITHSANFAYTFNGNFPQDEIKRVEKTRPTSEVTETVTQQAQIFSNNLAFSYLQKISVSERVRFAWKTKVDLGISTGKYPGRMTYDTNTGFRLIDATTTTTINGVKTKTGANDNWTYKTDSTQITLTPTVSLGIQWDISPKKVVFNAGTEIVPFMFSYSKFKTAADEALSGATTQNYNADLKMNEVESSKANIFMGFMFYLLPNLTIDTGVAYIFDGSTTFSIDKIFGSSLSIALTYKM